MDLGIFYMALSVKDIAVSKKFYEGLGFAAVENGGSVEEKWLVMANGTNKIGLFQDMFPQNTLTFNPTNAREIYENLMDAGYAFSHVSENKGDDKSPFYMALVDPDGNPILIDQEVK
ncbi:MAG: VOC family protein [Saprospiraceae bacterium]|nr:VOC family protein [Saprospiraceae bacterium]